MRHHARQVGQANAHGSELIVTKAAAHFHRLESACVGQLVFKILNLHCGKGEQRPQLVDRCVRFDHPFGDDVDTKIRSIGRKGRAVPIENPATTGRNKSEVDAIAFRQHPVALVLRDREIAHSCGKQQPDATLDTADEEAAALKTVTQSSCIEVLLL